MTLAIIILASVLVGFGGGWGVKGWKDTAKIAIVEKQKAATESQNAILVNANGNCLTDIDGVKKGVAVVIAQVEEREKAASDAMKAADVKIAQRAIRLKMIKTLSVIPPEPEAQCAAIVLEQIDYVRERRSAN